MKWLIVLLATSAAALVLAGCGGSKISASALANCETTYAVAHHVSIVAARSSVKDGDVACELRWVPVERH